LYFLHEVAKKNLIFAAEFAFFGKQLLQNACFSSDLEFFLTITTCQVWSAI